MNNTVIATSTLLKELKINISETEIFTRSILHNEGDSFEFISQTLSELNIEHYAVHVPKDKLYELPLPAIVQLSSKEKSMFYVVTNIIEGFIFLIDEVGERQIWSHEKFMKLWNGIAMLAMEI
ncbi:cysteine peptidase family C39 domain-containing protein [Zhouia sp. PK063]|uniref:cysteine peptidase family C39 domain-containing protein n=1 Tax=Zhouia sp. PK063 TaxID=3373602 RepID=UPI0037BCB0C4